MKKNLFILLAVILIISGCDTDGKKSTVKYDRTKVINELIGDESYVAAFGKLPDSTVSEKLRIRTHLAYVEQLLRDKPTDHLACQQQQNRTLILDHLHEYMLAGDFPKNYDIIGERRPCFLDKDGNICAVGYLVEQTESLALACKINSEYMYDWVSDMDIPELNDWIAGSGLTKEEFMLIQPSYQNNGTYITSDNVAIPVIAQLSAFNIVSTCINSKQLADGRSSNLAPFLGITTGAINIGYSALTISDGGSPFAFFGVLTGTSSIVTSSINLLFKKKMEKSNLSLSSNIFTTPSDRHIPGLTLSLRL